MAATLQSVPLPPRPGKQVLPRSPHTVSRGLGMRRLARHLVALPATQVRPGSSSHLRSGALLLQPPPDAPPPPVAAPCKEPAVFTRDGRKGEQGGPQGSANQRLKGKDGGGGRRRGGGGGWVLVWEGGRLPHKGELSPVTGRLGQGREGVGP